MNETYWDNFRLFRAKMRGKPRGERLGAAACIRLGPLAFMHMNVALMAIPTLAKAAREASAQ